MNIGIIFYSFSGHTLSVSRKLEEGLIASGFKVKREQLEPDGPYKLTDMVIKLKNVPSIEVYDILVLASPVHGGRMAAPMAGFLKELPGLKSRKIICLVTHFLPYSMGGKQMIQLFKDACESLGAEVVGTANIPRLRLRQKQYINKVIDMIIIKERQ